MQLIELKYYLDLIPKCDIFKGNDMVEIFFHVAEEKACYIATEFIKSADESFIIQNTLPEDETINYVARYEKKRTEDIAFLQYVLSKSSKEIGGFAIKNIPLMNFYLGIEIEPPMRCYGSVDYDTNSIWKIPIYGLNKYVGEETKENYRNLLKALYEWCDEELDYYSLPKKVLHASKTKSAQAIAIESFLNENYIPYKNRYEEKEYRKVKRRDVECIKAAREKDNEKFYEMLSQFKIRYDEIYHNLIKNGKVFPKWKSEYEMFKLIRKFHNDAVYQYKAAWLDRQSLDVFIPSRRIGVEYQGRQHYEVIEIFGGEEGYNKQKELDIKKKKVCAENNVNLIEWRYDEPINEIILRNKIKMP